MEKGGKAQPDAGLRSLNHCQYSTTIPVQNLKLIMPCPPTDQTQLPTWRYWPRQKLLPLVRYETPYLAWFQEKIRTPSLDSFFAFTANLGTHTFFMVFLPILFWCGCARFGRWYVEAGQGTRGGKGGKTCWLTLW